MTSNTAVPPAEKCAEQFSAWTDGIRKMLLEAGEKNAAARVDGYSFETFKAGYEAARAPASEVQADHIADERKMVAGEWQPIETARKTGCTLLLGYPNSLGKWRTVRGQWMSEAYIEEYWEDPDDVEPGWFETAEEAEDIPNCWPISPTHWMPLPAAPASSTGNQEVGS